MKFQPCADTFSISDSHPELDWDKNDPQHKMILQQIRFQDKVGTWDKRIKDLGAKTFCRPKIAIFHLDMAGQECSEAWDMVEGGWKQHKKNPKKSDADELLMELVDVAHFLFNAYIYMGGQPEHVLVASAVGKSRENVVLPEMGLDCAWGIGVRSMEGNGAIIRGLYSHAAASHGEEWEGEAATRINYLRMKISEVAEALRWQIRQNKMIIDGSKFPAGSGYVYIETIPWLCAAVDAIPGVDINTFYAAFMHKNAINFQRQHENY